MTSHVAHAPQIMQGISMLTLILSNVTSAIVAAGLAWYIRGRGMTGVKIDIANAQNEIEKIKAQINSASTAAVATVTNTAVG